MAICAVLGVAGCGGSDSPSSGSQDKPEAAKGAAPADAASAKAASRGKGADRPSRSPGSTVAVHGSQYGTILTDGDGRTLYLFTKETSDQSRCYGACAQAWPPFLTQGEPRAAEGARASLLGATRRSDGKVQVTYRGQPLYYYEGESQPGEVLCQGVDEFGGLWLVVAPDGTAIQ